MKINISILFISIFVWSNVFAQTPLVIPNTFTNGGIIDADQINQNFTTLKDQVNQNAADIVSNSGIGGVYLLDGNGDAFGLYLGAGPTSILLASEVDFITQKGYLGVVSLGDGLITTDPITRTVYYSQPNCQGNLYLPLSSNQNGNIIHGFVSRLGELQQLDYLPKGSTSELVAVQSYWVNGKTCASFVETVELYEVQPNDPEVTGISANIVGPVTLGSYQ